MARNYNTDNAFFDIDLTHLNNGMRTKYKAVSINYLIESLKNMQSSIRQNIAEGTAVFGTHKNSKNSSTKVTKL